MWRCKCDCGNEVIVRSASLVTGVTKSCGCLYAVTRKGKTSHASSYTRLYKIWDGIVQRCTNPNTQNYKSYGGRGIEMCDEWRNDFAAFKAWAMANGYNPDAPKWECTIDRIDVNGNYEPSNCRWVSMDVQRQNKRKGLRKPGLYKPVVRVDEEGNVIERYPSVRDAAESVGCRYNNISAVCHGAQVTTHGMRFRFAQEVA